MTLDPNSDIVWIRAKIGVLRTQEFQAARRAQRSYYRANRRLG
jgi:hypothetical protein